MERGHVAFSNGVKEFREQKTKIIIIFSNLGQLSNEPIGNVILFPIVTFDIFVLLNAELSIVTPSFISISSDKFVQL